MASHFHSRNDIEKNGSFVQLTDMGTSHNPSRRTSDGPPVKPNLPGSWSQDPKHLRTDIKYEQIMDIFDVTLCCLPLLLMGKILVCFAASKKNNDNHGASADLSRVWSYFITGLNSQVG
jgi:hypothetical protein